MIWGHMQHLKESQRGTKKMNTEMKIHHLRKLKELGLLEFSKNILNNFIIFKYFPFSLFFPLSHSLSLFSLYPSFPLTQTHWCLKQFFFSHIDILVSKLMEIEFFITYPSLLLTIPIKNSGINVHS